MAPDEEGAALVVIVRDELGEFWLGVWDVGEGLCVYEVAAAAACGPGVFCTADWARKAARKPEKKGLLDDMTGARAAAAAAAAREDGGLWPSLSSPHAAGAGCVPPSLGSRSDSRRVVEACHVRVT